MGITKLADLIRSDAPDAISYKEISDYTGKVIALDTSIVLNQFRTALSTHQHVSPLTGLFFRTLTFLEHDIKPVFVFDGKPPKEKRAVLEKRAQMMGWSAPSCSGNASPETRDSLHLLNLLGVPVIKAPGDGEALCAHLVKQGKVDAVASEDMDTLTFGADVLIRQLNAKKDSEVVEYSLPKLLSILKVTHKEFVDLCILLGCDYCDKIAGFGPKRALTLIQRHRTIENIVLNINRKYQDARKLFLNAPLIEPSDLVWTEPDEEALVQFLCREKHVKEQRVRSRMVKFRETREKRRKERDDRDMAGQSRQTRMEDFFRVTRKRKKAVEAEGSTAIKRK